MNLAVRATPSWRRIAGLVLTLVLTACASHSNHPYYDNALVAQKISVDYDDLVAATLLHYNEQGGRYCLNVFHRGPSSRLRAKMALYGHHLDRCAEELLGLSISSITEPKPGIFRVTLLDQCGALCGVGIRFTLARKEKAEFEVVSSRLEAEF